VAIFKIYDIFKYASGVGLVMKCDICKKTLAETFLKKIVGSYVKDEKGRLHPVCRECQKKLKSKEELLKNI